MGLSIVSQVSEIVFHIQLPSAEVVLAKNIVLKLVALLLGLQSSISLRSASLCYSTLRSKAQARMTTCMEHCDVLLRFCDFSQLFSSWEVQEEAMRYGQDPGLSKEYADSDSAWY